MVYYQSQTQGNVIKGNIIVVCFVFRSVADFPRFLGIAMETFLTLCDDPEADIRMVADECLNRSIKVRGESYRARYRDSYTMT